MSYSGAGLYDDDTGADVRARYRELVADGATGEQATDTLVEEWGAALDDADEAGAFWLALADTQWTVGRLEDRVRDRAQTVIETGDDLARFDHDPGLHGRRRAVLADLAERLGTPQRAPTRLRKPFRSRSPVRIGDVFWFTTPGGRRVPMRCVDLLGDEGDDYPTVEILDAVSDGRPLDLTALKARTPIARPEGRWPDLVSLVRYRGDPDPADLIEVVAAGTPIDRRRTLPATMVSWTEIESHLARAFGD